MPPEMNDSTPSPPESSPEEPVSKEPSTTEPTPTKAAQPEKRSVQLGGLIVLAVIVLSLLWYLTADRYTPYTTQARVQRYVVGVAPKVAGIVTEMWVENNEEVAAGQSLFQIDPSQYQIAVEAARSNLENARNQVAAGDAAVDAARANLEATLANLDKSQKDTDRLRSLRERDSGSISQRRVENSEAALEAAISNVSKAEAAIQQAIEQKGGDDEATNAIINGAQSSLDKAKLDLANTIVKATANGIVTDLRTDAGQFAGAGQPVLTLISMHDVWINAEFTENNLGHMADGQKVEILFDSLPGEIFEGTVRSIGLGVSSGSAPPPGSLPSISNDRDWLRQSQRFAVLIGFDEAQDENLHKQLRIGGQASIIVYTGDRPVSNFLGRIYIRLMSKFSYMY